MTARLTILPLLILVLLQLTGCASVNIPKFHQTAVFADPTAVVAPALETPVNLTPQRLDDRRWIVQSPVVSIRRGTGFDQAIGSWNIDIEPGAAASIDLSVNDGTGWSPRLRLGHVGNGALLDVPMRRLHPTDDSAGLIDVDYFVARRAYTRAQLTVTLVSASNAAPSPPGRVSRLAICLSSVESRHRVNADELVGSARRAAISVDVPYRAQRSDDASLAGRLCSPASLSMVLAAFGVDLSVRQVADRVHDSDHDLYGNWPRNTQAAFECGVPGFVTRFTDWESVLVHLRRGEPVVASIRAPRGLIRNAPYRELDGGHLIVLRGLDGRGGVLVNDPAGESAGQGQRIYAITDLSKAWLDLGNGTAYVLLRPPLSVAK